MKFSRTTITAALIAGLISLAVYLRALGCGFVNWDDGVYVLNNTAIRHLDGNFLYRVFFTTLEAGFWLPLTWTSFAIDYHFWGLNPLGYHLTNILLHAANTGLVVLLADSLLKHRRGLMVEGREPKTAWCGEEAGYRYPAMLLLAALLFAIHPARVESVVWVTERKDVLNGLFTLGSLLLYLDYLRRKGADSGKGAAGAYGVSLLLFLLSLMAKPASIVLPVMLLVLDWYPLGRLQRGNVLPVVIEKLPYLALSAAVSVISIAANAQAGTLYSLGYFPLAMRAIVSGNALFEYFRLMILPFGIIPLYNLPQAIPQTFVVKAALALLFLCGSFWLGRKRPWLTASLLLFLIPLAPTPPFFLTGTSIALACRYTYLASILPAVILAAVASSAYSERSHSWRPAGRYLAGGLLVALLVFYGGMTQRLIGTWKDSGTFWTRVIAFQPFDSAYYYRGLFYSDTGNYPAAVADFSTSLELAAASGKNDLYNLYAFRGEALTMAGLYAEAVEDFSAAIALFPHRLYFYHRGMALKALGRFREADEDFGRAGPAKGRIYWFQPGSDTSAAGKPDR